MIANTRDYISFLQILDTCQKHNVSVEVPGEGAISFDSNQEKLMASIKAFLAAEEREKIRERTKAGLVAAKKRGVKLGRPPGSKTNKGFRKAYPQELIDNIEQLNKAGMSSYKIASVLSGKFDLSASKVQRILKLIKT